MSFLSDLLTGGAGSIVESVADVAAKFITTDKDREAAQLEIEKLGLQREEAYLADTDSARKMQIAALAQDDKFSKRFIYWFSIFWSLFAMVFIGFTSFGDIPTPNMRIVDTVLGFLLGTAISSIFNFFLGTNMQSRTKDATISAMSQGSGK